MFKPRLHQVQTDIVSLGFANVYCIKLFNSILPVNIVLVLMSK